MDDRIHDIYDVILKLIILVYGIDFLKYVGIDNNIKEILKTEFVSFNGKKMFLDFLCRLEDDTLCHIEFQFPKARIKDLGRFFNYNITAEVKYGSVCDTLIISFTHSGSGDDVIVVGKSKSFHPDVFYLGDIDFENEFKKINKKVESNLKLSSFDEINLMVRCLVNNFKNRFQAIRQICKILQYEELFNPDKFDFIKFIIKLEIDYFLSQEEKDNIGRDVNMTPEMHQMMADAIDEVHRKHIYEAREEGIDEGIEIGRDEGIEIGRDEGREEGMEIVARKMKGSYSVGEISKITGLSVDKINSL